MTFKFIVLPLWYGLAAFNSFVTTFLHDDHNNLFSICVSNIMNNIYLHKNAVHVYDLNIELLPFSLIINTL